MMDKPPVMDLPALEEIPIRIDDSGAVRVGKTRVTLHTVITSYRLGRTPETMIDQFPALTLSDVYLVIGYYLRHMPEVDAYMDDYDAAAERLRAEHEHEQIGLREKLLKRLADKQKSDVSFRG